VGTCEDAGFAHTLLAARQGSLVGLSSVFREFQPPLLRYLRACEPRVADDLAGETWLAVTQRINTFEGDQQAFGSWLFTIARHRLMDFRRSSSRREPEAIARLSSANVAPTAEQTALDNVSAQDSVALIVRLLSTDQAEVILLRILGDLSFAQIAGVMDRDVDWVGVTLHRGLKRLASRLGTRVRAPRPTCGVGSL
jgi:RNA polymerase sigma-70 factor (ECF subfamily)